MYYKIFDEDGDYLDQNGQTMNLVSCVNFISADPNYSFGWAEFPDEYAAMEHYELTKMPTQEEILNLI